MEHTVLVIEDDPLNMKLMRGLLGLGGYRMLEADEAETGLKMAAEHRPDLILMDVNLPGLDGLSATRRLKDDPQLGSIPVIALTGLAMEGDREKALAAGCMDHITKPVNTRSFLDSLGALLAPACDRPAPEAPPRDVAQRQYSRILFKGLNDRFGHPAGDMVLQESARLIREAIREVDLAARYGREEFAVVLPYSDAQGARVVARRILNALRALDLENASGARLGAITASIGIAACPVNARDARTLIQQADAMLYRAKQNGKNRIETPPA